MNSHPHVEYIRRNGINNTITTYHALRKLGMSVESAQKAIGWREMLGGSTEKRRVNVICSYCKVGNIGEEPYCIGCGAPLEVW